MCSISALNFSGWGVASFRQTKEVVSWDEIYFWWRCYEDYWNDNEGFRLWHKISDKAEATKWKCRKWHKFVSHSAKKSERDWRVSNIWREDGKNSPESIEKNQVQDSRGDPEKHRLRGNLKNHHRKKDS